VSDGTWGLPYGAILKYREWYGSKGPNVGLKLTADLVAQGILTREGAVYNDHGQMLRGPLEQIAYGAADPAIFIRNGGPSIGETMAMKGCNWRPADNKRLPGWELLRQRLVGEDGRPMIYFLETCVDTIRTLPTLQHDEDHPEDLDTEAEDHAADETRYACASRPWVSKANPPKGLNLPRLPGEMTISELVAKRTAKRRAAMSND
jgi:hypothetical protein